MSPRKVVTVSGVGASGASAVTLDLVGYGDCFSLGGFEPGIFRNTGGLYELYSTIESNDLFIFHEQFSKFCTQIQSMKAMIDACVADTYKVSSKCENVEAVTEFLSCFEKFKNKCIQNEFFWPFHVYGNEHLDAYEPFISPVLAKGCGSFITKQWIKLFKPEFKIDRSHPQRSFLKRTNLNKSEFLSISKDFLREMMEILSKKKTFVSLCFLTSNRVSSFEEQSQFFDDLRMIFVIRDPRDTFTGWTKRNWLKDDQVDVFISIYKYLSSDYPYSHEKILNIRFEDFVRNYDETSEKILSFIEVSPDSYDANVAIYDVKDSVKNIGRWKTYPNQDVMKYIASELKEYLYET